MKNSSDKQVNAPLPLSSLEQYAQEILTPIKRGESVTSIWIPMAGRRVRNKFIISNPQLFEKSVGSLENYLMVYVEPLELTEESVNGYFNLITRSIIDSLKEKGISLGKEEANYFSDNYSQQVELLGSLIKEITNQELELVLFLGEFDELTFANSVFYNNLKSLWSKSQGKLNFVFLFIKDVTDPESVKEYNELNELLLQNIVYVSICKGEEIDYLIEYFSKQFNRPFSQDEKDLLKRICGGHPYLLRACSRLISLEENTSNVQSLETMLINHSDPRSAMQKIFDLLKPEEREILKQIATKKHVDLPIGALRLVKLGLIDKLDDEYWIPFSQLFLSVITDGSSDTKPTLVQEDSFQRAYLQFDNATGAVLFNNNNIEDKFTRTEYEILRFFLNDPSKLRTRDEIGEAMWGKLSHEKYSDWAIDQVMSKLRKKLKILGSETSLVTVRGRGYKLATSEA